MDTHALKRSARRLVLELVAVACVAFPSLQTGQSASQAWRFVGRHPTLLAHAVLGAVIAVDATALLVRSARAGRPGWATLAASGLVLIVVAAVAGVLTVHTQRNAAVDAMAVAWVVALLGYGGGWIAGRRAERREAAPV